MASRPQIRPSRLPASAIQVLPQENDGIRVDVMEFGPVPGLSGLVKGAGDWVDEHFVWTMTIEVTNLRRDMVQLEGYQSLGADFGSHFNRFEECRLDPNETVTRKIWCLLASRQEKIGIQIICSDSAGNQFLVSTPSIDAEYSFIERSQVVLNEPNFPAFDYQFLRKYSSDFSRHNRSGVKYESRMLCDGVTNEFYAYIFAYALARSNSEYGLSWVDFVDFPLNYGFKIPTLYFSHIEISNYSGIDLLSSDSEAVRIGNELSYTISFILDPYLTDYVGLTRRYSDLEKESYSGFRFDLENLLRSQRVARKQIALRYNIPEDELTSAVKEIEDQLPLEAAENSTDTERSPHAFQLAANESLPNRKAADLLLGDESFESLPDQWERWDEVADRKETPPEFLRRVWGRYIASHLFYRDDLQTRDLPLYKKLAAWAGNRKIPLGSVMPPKISERARHLAESAPLGSPEQRYAAKKLQGRARTKRYRSDAPKSR